MLCLGTSFVCIFFNYVKIDSWDVESLTGYSPDTCTELQWDYGFEDKWALHVDFAHLCTKDLLICGKGLVLLVQNKDVLLTSTACLCLQVSNSHPP